MFGNPIHRLWWLYLPILFIIAQIAIEVFVPDQDLAHVLSENGPHETLEALFAFCAFVLSLWLLTKVDWAKQKLIGGALVAAMVGSFYITGEEISWGQHILNWSTPEYWTAFNDQNETNLHNTSAWLDQKPRLLLFIGIVVGGLIVPYLRWKSPRSLPEKWAPLYPSVCVVPAALGVLGPYLLQEIFEHIFGFGLFHRVSEVQEVYMYLFVFLYLLDLRNREFS